MNRFGRIAAALTALVAIAAIGVQGTTIVHMSLRHLSQAAKLIIRGSCTETSVRWDAGEIWTFTKFRVDDFWRGSAASQITVRLLGGSAGNITSTVSGVPHFHVGEDVILFLEPTASGDFTVVAWQQGTFRLHRDGVAGRISVTQDSAAFEMLDPATNTFKSSGIQNMPLDLFRAQIASALKESPGEK